MEPNNQKNKKDKKGRKQNMSGNMQGNNIKVFSLTINPLIIIVLSIVIGLGIFAFYSNQPDTQSIKTSDLIKNIKGDKYSELIIRDSGEAIATTKQLNILELTEEITFDTNIEETEGLDVVASQDFETVGLEDFVSRLAGPPVGELFEQSIFEWNKQNISQIVVGENFIFGKLNESDGGDILVQGISMEDLERELSSQNLDLDTLGISILRTKSAAQTIEPGELSSRIESGKYSDIWLFDGLIIAGFSEENIITETAEYTDPWTSFSEFLQNEGISFDTDNLEIQFENAQRIDYGLIFNILSFLIVGFLVFSILRGINGGGRGLMQFGQSKAKMFFGKKPEVTFKDVAGVDSAKEELNEVVMFLKNPKKFTKLGARIPKGLLMVGPPGTGKTLLAKAIAGEAGVPFFHTSGSEFEEMLVGAGASRVRDLFSKAKKASPALIFIDEIDAVARKRGTTVQSSSTEQTLNQILVEMDGFEKNVNVIVIAATNRPDVLDPAILRPGRFDRRIVVEMPDINGREEILQIHAKNKPFAADVNLKTVARRTVGYSGADLENMLNEAAIIVAKDDRKEITAKDIEESANRVSMGRQRNIQRDEEELKKTAYHEAGHAIVAKLTPESDPVHRITIISRGMALGVTMQLPEKDKYSQSYTEMESRLRVLMAGRAAEELIYGPEKITSGASNDIEKATGMARRMVKSYGYSDKLGLVKYGQSNELQYLGYGYGEQSDYSPHTAKLIDEEVKRIIDEAYGDAMDILKTNNDLLQKITDDLMEKEVIEGDEFNKYFDK